MTLKNNECCRQDQVWRRGRSLPHEFLHVWCGGQTVKQFSKMFHGADVHYFTCLTCNHLTAGEINTNPSYDGGSYFKEIDTGWKNRNKRILDFVRWIRRLPAIQLSAQSMVLDFGCGIGQLVEDLNRIGFNGYGFEPFLEGAYHCRIGYSPTGIRREESSNK